MHPKFSYDYSEMLEELQEELQDGELSLDNNIQVLRTDQPAFELYRPIIDWYYNDNIMVDMFKEEFEECQEIKSSYERDKTKLESMKVVDVIAEMEVHNNII